MLPHITPYHSLIFLMNTEFPRLESTGSLNFTHLWGGVLLLRGRLYSEKRYVERLVVAQNHWLSVSF